MIEPNTTDLEYAHGVVSICSPVKMALAPAMKHIACFDSSSVCLPAAKRMMVWGRTIRAVATVLRSVWYGIGYIGINTGVYKRRLEMLPHCFRVVCPRWVPGR